MPNGEANLFSKLVLIGALIGVGQLLVGQEPISIRLFIGRIILGSAVSLISGVALIHFSDLHELALIGIACMLGIAGHTAVEAAVQHWLKRKKDKTP